MHVGRHHLLFTLALCGILASSAAVHAQGRSEVALSALERIPHVPNQVLVQFRAGVTEEDKESLRGRVQAHSEEIVVAQERRSDLKGDLELWNLPPGLAIAVVVDSINRIMGIRPDVACQIVMIPHQAFIDDADIYTRTIGVIDPRLARLTAESITRAGPVSVHAPKRAAGIVRIV